jgi:hypothetical protein
LFTEGKGAGIAIQPLHYYIIEEARPLTPAFCCGKKYRFIYRYLLCTDCANIHLDTTTGRICTTYFLRRVLTSGSLSQPLPDNSTTTSTNRYFWSAYCSQSNHIVLLPEATLSKWLQPVRKHQTLLPHPFAHHRPLGLDMETTTSPTLLESQPVYLSGLEAMLPFLRNLHIRLDIIYILLPGPRKHQLRLHSPLLKPHQRNSPLKIHSP